VAISCCGQYTGEARSVKETLRFDRIAGPPFRLESLIDPSSLRPAELRPKPSYAISTMQIIINCCYIFIESD